MHLVLKGGLILFLTFWWLFAAAVSNFPKPPKFLRAPSLLTESDDIRVELRIETNPAIRSIVLEAWETDALEHTEDGMALCPTQARWLRRSSFVQVDETNAQQRTFPFHWRSGLLAAGCYVLVGKVVSVNPFRSAETRHTVMVN